MEAVYNLISLWYIGEITTCSQFVSMAGARSYVWLKAGVQVEFLSYTKPRYYYHPPPDTHTHTHLQENKSTCAQFERSQREVGKWREIEGVVQFAVVYPEQAIMDLWHKHTATMIHFKECPKPTLPGATEGSCSALPHALLGQYHQSASQQTFWLVVGCIEWS